MQSKTLASSARSLREADFSVGSALERQSHDDSSNRSFSQEEFKSNDVTAFSAKSGNSYSSVLSNKVSVGLSGLAGTPNIN